MKMKKTQSLKLMLLGLFALVSTGVWAQTYKADKGVVYACYEANGDAEAYAKVVGVVESALPAMNSSMATALGVENGKQIRILDKIDGYPVTAFAEDWTTGAWYQNGDYGTLPKPQEQIVTDPATGVTTYTNSQVAGSTSYNGYQTCDASDIEAPIYMLIQASKMTSIQKADVEKFTIVQFALGQYCGITAIPDYLFAPMIPKTSVDHQRQINTNKDKIAELERQVSVWTNDQANNADGIAYWTNDVNERQTAVDRAQTTQWWKTQKGELDNLHKQLVALEGDEEQGILGLKQLIINLFSVWQDASDEIIAALAAGPESPLVNALSDDEKQILSNIRQAMLDAKISPNADGGYDMPLLPTVNSMINKLKNETIPNKESEMNNTKKFAADGHVPESVYNQTLSLNDLKQMLANSEAKLDELDKSDDIAANNKEIARLKKENEKLAGDLSELNENGKNETLKQVNLYDQQLETIGEGAFANCVNAKFGFTNDKFGPAIKLIKQKAFQNTLLEIVDLSIATDENLDVLWNAFYGTPLTTLKLKGIQSTVIGPEHVMCYVQGLKKAGKDLIYTDGCGFEYKTLENTNTNNTLTTVTLPETEKYNQVYARTFEDCIALPSIEIPAQVTDIDDKAFENCIALATVTFAGDKIAHIGEAAFFRTAVPAFDFSNQFKLATIEDYAFAANCALTTVNLPADKDKYSNEQAPLKALFANTFKYSPNLTTVTFNGNMFYLAEGLFDSNKLEVLDLSKTKVLVLNDLFHAGQNHPVTDENGEIQYLKDDTGAFVLDGEGKKITLYSDPVNTTLKSVILPEGLLAINNFALAGLQCPKFQEDLVIPSSVVFTGVGAFRNSTYVKNIKFPETTQQFFERGTFEQCLSLQTVELFVEEALYTPSQAFTVTTANRAGFTAALSSAYNKLLSKQPAYNNLYVDGEINLPEWMTTTTPSVGDPLNIDPFLEALKRYNVPFRYYDAIYGDPNRISGNNQFGQWMSMLGGDGWYGSSDNWNSEIFIGSLWGFDDEWFDGRPGHLKATIYVTPNDVLQLRADGYEEAFSTLAPYPSKIKLTNLGDYSYGFINKTHGVWVPYKTEDGASVVVYSAYQDGNNVILHPAKIKNGYYKVAGYDPEDGAYAKGYYWVPDNADWDAAETLANAADRASAAVIRVEGNVKEIPYLAQHSRSTHTIPAGMATYEEVHIAPRFMSTLDTENELQILDEDVYPATNMNWYKFGVYQNEVNFWYVSSGKLAAGNVAFQGVGVNGLSRLNAIFVDQNEATAVLGIKEYRDMMQNGTIYNLQGVKVTTPVKGQMYIQNGNKFIQK